MSMFRDLIIASKISGTRLYAWHHPNADDGDIVTYRYDQSDMQYFRDPTRDLDIQDGPSVAKYDPSGGSGEGSMARWKPVYTLYTVEEHPAMDSVLRVNTGLNINEYRDENGFNAGEFVATYTLDFVSEDYLTISCKQKIPTKVFVTEVNGIIGYHNNGSVIHDNDNDVDIIQLVNDGSMILSRKIGNPVTVIRADTNASISFSDTTTGGSGWWMYYCNNASDFFMREDIGKEIELKLEIIAG